MKSINIILHENLSKNYILKLQFFDPVECQMSRDFASCLSRDRLKSLYRYPNLLSIPNHPQVGRSPFLRSLD